MIASPTATRGAAALLLGLALAAPSAAQTGVPAARTERGGVEQRTIFTTPDFRQDREQWTDPAYYRNNTVGQLRGMAIGTEPSGGTGQAAASRVYGSEGTGKVGALELGSPYPFQTALEHYDAWLKEARGGTKHTKDTIPDWSGRWMGGPSGLNGGP